MWKLHWSKAYIRFMKPGFGAECILETYHQLCSNLTIINCTNGYYLIPCNTYAMHITVTKSMYSNLDDSSVLKQFNAIIDFKYQDG